MPGSNQNWQSSALDTSLKLLEEAEQEANLEARIARDGLYAPPISFKEFIRDAWATVDPGLKIRWNWHIDAIADCLDAVAQGHITNLIINIPPGHAKSIIVAVDFPAWMWLFRPQWRGLFSSYDASLSIRDSVKCRDLIESEWYQKTFEPTWKLKPDQNAKSKFDTTRNGFRFSHSVSGAATGWRGDAIICDDPLNALKRHSVKARDEVIDWWDKAMSSRLNDMTTGVKILIMQRLHENDLTGHILRKNYGYEHLCLPSRFEEARRSRVFITIPETGERRLLVEDHRTKEGEILFPGLFNEEVLAKIEEALQDDGFAAQHQHNPQPAEGGMFKRKYWRFWCYPGQEKDQPDALPPIIVKSKDGKDVEIWAEPLPKWFTRQIQSWDMTFKAGTKADYVVGQVWGQNLALFYLLDQVRKQMGFDETVDEVKVLSRRWMMALEKYVENKANGPAVVDHLRKEMTGLMLVEPRGDKEERAWTVLPAIKSGNVYLPHPHLAGYEWVEDLLSEFAVFPNGNNDDQVDALTQALDEFTHGADDGDYSSVAATSELAGYVPM